MATLGERWILSILLINLSNFGAPADPPAPPSRPDCCRPCDEKSCSADIHCAWDPVPYLQVPSNYSLHWESKNREYANSLSSLSRVIRREHFFHDGELRVWVVAKNQHGSAKSQESVFHPADIVKPPPPKITLKEQEPLQIEWHSFCGELHFSMGTCDVRHWIAGNQVRLEHDGGFLHTYTFDSPMPGTVYEFQVRCACSIGLMSDWSPNHRISSAEKAPVGELDIWRDCETFPSSDDCTLTWKVLPVSHACGVILGYIVELFYNNGTHTPVNVSTADPRGQLSCDEVQCHLTSSLKDVSSVSVSAFNARGATLPSRLAVPTSGQDKNEQVINLRMNEENLTASWDPSTQLSQNPKKYVVQFKQAGCPPGQGFDWVKVNKSQSTVFFKGQFEKYTPFQVSLFTVSHSGEIYQLSSTIGYSLETTPGRVPLFEVLSIAATRVTLFWMPVPLSKRKGVIQYYQIGLIRQNVYHVSASPQWENGTFELKHLNPGQEYEVGIRAVTEAGPGENATVRFKTKQHEHYVHLLPALLAPFFLLIIYTAFLLRSCGAENKRCAKAASCFWEKVPDPSNSQVFRHVKHQKDESWYLGVSGMPIALVLFLCHSDIGQWLNSQDARRTILHFRPLPDVQATRDQPMNDPLAWICMHTCEPHPKISVLEVVKIQPRTLDSTRRKTPDSDKINRPMARDGCSQIDYHDEQRGDHRNGREEYSKMLDSDEERVMEEGNGDCWDSSEDEQFASGYEKHFMPTCLEILEI